MSRPISMTPERVHYHSRDFQAKLTTALARIGLALSQHKRPYVAFSGGKDSAVVSALVEAHRLDVTHVWGDEELILPETLDYMTRLKQVAGDRLVVVMEPDLHGGWFRAWTDQPYWHEPLSGAIRLEYGSDTMRQPGYSETDDWMAAQGYDLTFTGLRAEESHRRRDWLVQTDGTYRMSHGTGRRVCPIWDWTADDVWALITGWRLAYNPAYEVMERIGIPRHRQRIGPLPLTPRSQLVGGWPELLTRLEARYGERWR